MIYVSKDIQKCTLPSTHHDITDFEVEGIERNKKKSNISRTKHGINLEQNSQIVLEKLHFQKLLFNSGGNLLENCLILFFSIPLY